MHAAESTPDPEPTPDPDPTPDPEPSVDKSRLESAINAAGSVQQANFTPNSWKAFSEAMGNAQKVAAAAMPATSVFIDACEMCEKLMNIPVFTIGY